MNISRVRNIGLWYSKISWIFIILESIILLIDHLFGNKIHFRETISDLFLTAFIICYFNLVILVLVGAIFLFKKNNLRFGIINILAAVAYFFIMKWYLSFYF